MLASYGYIAIFAVISLLFPVAPLVIARFISPRKPSLTKRLPYECGMEPIGKSWIQFNARYYLFALVFVVFDVETVFLYPWAVSLRQLGLFGLIEISIFVAILVVGYVYAWRKKALEWS